MTLTQKERILNSLKAAGGLGVRSDVYIREFMPRAAARVKELQEDGWDITSERDGKFVVWTLNAGTGADTERSSVGRDADERASGALLLASQQMVSVDSGVADEPSFPSEDYSAPPATSSHYDPFEEWAA